MLSLNPCASQNLHFLLMLGFILLQLLSVSEWEMGACDLCSL